MEWREIKSRKTRVFQMEDEPELILITKTGFKDEYFVTDEDAYHSEYHGRTDTLTKNQIKDIYNIEL